MTAQLASLPSSTKKDRCTLIEQSQYFQGSIRADPSKLRTVSFANDLWSDSIVAKVLIHMSPFSG